MRKLDPLRILPQRFLDIFEGDPMSLARVRIVLLGVLAPYLARVPGIAANGLEWLTDYVGNVAAIAFLQSFNAIAWGSLVFLSYFVRRPIAIAVPALVGLGFVARAHSGLDLAGDPQNGVALVFIPIYALPVIGMSFVLSFVAFRGWRVSARKSSTRLAPKCAASEHRREPRVRAPHAATRSHRAR